MGRTLRRTTLGIVLLLALSGCGSGSADHQGVPTTPAGAVHVRDASLESRLLGHTFVSASYVRDGHSLRTVRGTELRITFADPRATDATVVATGGCNTSSGRFTIVAGRLVVRRISSTLIGCLDERPRQDALIDALLAHRPAIRIDGGMLVLRGDAITIRARRTH